MPVPLTSLNECLCGGDPQLLITAKAGGKVYEIQCPLCESATGPFHEKDLAKKEWNTKTRYLGALVDDEDYDEDFDGAFRDTYYG